ncbi:MAG: transcriptional regulator, partial [Tabrizicola sp.]
GQAAPSYAHGDMMSDKEALELVRSYYAIPEAQRRRLFDLARVLSEAA